MFTSDDKDDPEYAAHQDDKTELEIVGAGDESKIQRRRAYSDTEA